MRVEIVDYDPAWPEGYQREAERVRAALGSAAAAIEHVGSTSVAGLAAKDVLDIQVSVSSFEPMSAYRGPLESLGYEYRTDTEPEHRFFRLADGSGRRLAHVHVCEAGSRWERRHLAFRDLLRADPEAAAEYEREKLRLAPQFDNSIEYAAAKTEVIRRLERRSGAL